MVLPHAMATLACRTRSSGARDPRLLVGHRRHCWHHSAGSVRNLCLACLKDLPAGALAQCVIAMPSSKMPSWWHDAVARRGCLGSYDAAAQSKGKRAQEE